MRRLEFVLYSVWPRIKMTVEVCRVGQGAKQRVHANAPGNW